MKSSVNVHELPHSLRSTEDTDMQTFVTRLRADSTPRVYRVNTHVMFFRLTDQALENEDFLWSIAGSLVCEELMMIQSRSVQDISANHQKIHTPRLHPRQSACPLISLWHHHHHHH